MRHQPAPSDSDLVAGCLNNDDEAWVLLVRRYANLVWSVARRFDLDDDDAADVFQNTWASVWESLADIREPEKLSAWIITVTSRLAYQQYQRGHRRRTHQAPDQVLEQRPDPAAPPDEIVQADEEAIAVRRAVAGLPRRSRELIYYLFYDPTAPPYVEIARRLGVSPDTVGSLRTRCLRQLRTMLEAQQRIAESKFC